MQFQIEVLLQNTRTAPCYYYCIDSGAWSALQQYGCEAGGTACSRTIIIATANFFFFFFFFFFFIIADILWLH